LDACASAHMRRCPSSSNLIPACTRKRPLKFVRQVRSKPAGAVWNPKTSSYNRVSLPAAIEAEDFDRLGTRPAPRSPLPAYSGSVTFFVIEGPSSIPGPGIRDHHWPADVYAGNLEMEGFRALG
jgi:hypothetical protein